jgi:ribonuclease P protein component
MTPPDVPLTSHGAGTQVDPAASSCLPVLKKRSDFLAASRARRAPVAGFLLQARQRSDVEPARGARIGFTCSKKLGNAVTRNRAKRRLRALMRAVIPALGQPGWDYVLVGRPDATVSRPYRAMQLDLERALTQIHPKPA